MSTATNPALQTQSNPAATTSTGTNPNTNTNPDTDLAASLLTSKQPNTNTNASSTDTNKADPSAARAMSHTGAWKPALDRRQSWDAQEYKHDLLKRQYMGGEPGKAGRAGFSEV